MKVAGYCPMGCGEWLHVDDIGLFCEYPDCPRPRAAGDILNERETDHIVIFDAKGFTIQHPLRERLDGDLFTCGLHQQLRERAAPPSKLGRYRVSDAGNTYEWIGES